MQGWPTLRHEGVHSRIVRSYLQPHGAAAHPPRLRLVLSCLPTLGGSATTTGPLAQVLAERGHDVHGVSGARPVAVGHRRESMRVASPFTARGVTVHLPVSDHHPVLADALLDSLKAAELVGRMAPGRTR